MDDRILQLLLADDDPDDCELFVDAINELDVSTDLRVVNDGEKLMQYLKETDTQLPDMLFLDLNMPKKNGFECLTEIKNDEKLKQVPVIIFSTSFDNMVANRLYKNGAKHYIRKPNSFDTLKKVINDALLQGMTITSAEPSIENFVIEP